MDDIVDNRVALVTGGSRGIGAAVALRLARDGADVVLTYQHAAEAASAVVAEIEAGGRRALAVRADSGDRDAATAAVERVVDRFGRIDVLVNNAGALRVGPIGELGPAEFEEVVAVNVRAPFLASRAAAAHMTAGGRIVNIGSNVAERVTFPGFSLYALSKSALVGLTRGLARELGPRGITVNQVNPGPVDTDMNPADGPLADAINGFTALGRFGTPDEIAATVSHLAGDGGAYVTGAVIAVDGGFNG
ncbi:3-oxoacyl-ACP reductase family protein [Saccharothrix longispora]|uniref:3-oxoacyl-[acyl-carrier protein] reductase n=1 Tax=Saccharothrix longispora TaxID=33920 RepID=A0ABU1PQ23_9PSEU|nr:3-oxoacyl-ACP reductase family protein [Saccharothrix longispora]MDR6592750.1 3-oxoacyl-[acyl-carrier protein] reductase [Saccharothrix longispora]